MKQARGLVLTSVLGLFACSSGANPSSDAGLSRDDRTGDGPSTTGTIAQLCGELAGSRCARFKSCLPDAFAIRYAADGDCTAEIEKWCLARYTAEGAQVTAEQLAPCVAAYGAQSCTDLSRLMHEDNPALPAACAALPAGKLAAGASCAFDSQCAGGLCAKTPPRACGLCAARVPAGQSCKTDEECAAGLVCSTDGTCATRAELGESCAKVACHAGQRCVANACTDAVADGATCNAASNPSECNWPAARYCDGASKTCKVQPVRAEGEECGYIFDAGVYRFRGACGPGLRCALNAVRGLCVKPVADGQGCIFAGGPDGAQCDRNSSCVDGVCVATTAASCQSFQPPQPPAGPNPGKLPVFPNLGGPRLHKVNLITVVFPGYAFKSEVTAFGDYLASSGLFAEAGAEYGFKTLTHVKTVEVDEALPMVVSNEDIQDYLTKKMSAGVIPKPAPFDPDNATYYLLYLPKGVTMIGAPYGQTCSNIGGYHDLVAFPYPFVYGVIADCGTVAPYSELERIEQAAFHEVVEGSADPAINMSPAHLFRRPSVWNYLGGEPADLCAGDLAARDGFTVQRVYSSAQAMAGDDPCLPHAAGNPVYFNVTSPADTLTVAAGTTAQIVLTGWASGDRADWQLSTRTLRNSITLPPEAISLDKTTIGKGGTATLSVQIPADAKSGSVVAVSVQSTASDRTDFHRHVWPVLVHVQ